MSIKLKVLIFLISIGLIMSLCIGGYSYYDARNQIFEDALRQAEVVSSFALASRTYTVKTMRPLAMKIAGPESFHPELMGGFFIARAIADLFAESQPGYSFKQAALNPVNSDNQADGQEREIVQFFRSNPGVKEKKGVVDKLGQKFFYVAQPVRTQKGCLKCHGKVEDAPAGRVARYTSGGGYNYKLNDVVATFVTYIPIDTALQNVKFRAVKVAGVGLIFVFFLTAGIWFFLKVKVLSPIIRLTETADRMSLGKGLDKELQVSSNDEIGKLYESFNRMRKSVVKLISMVKKKK